ncbi:hypothetical protein ACLMJK_003969 [Lecanora helva]
MAARVKRSESINDPWSPKRPKPSRTRSSYRSDIHLLDNHPWEFPEDGLRSHFGDSGHALKVGAHNGRGHAILRYVFHTLPVAAALALVILNCKQYYIGGELAGPDNEDTERFGGLLLAAKLHELLMLVSLGTIIFACTRQEIACQTGIPLDTLLVGFHIDGISWLWSPEFLGIAMHKWKATRKRKAFLCFLILVCALLGLTVGVSSAALVKPRLDNWPAGSTTLWLNATSDILSPQTLQDSSSLEHCALDTGDTACPYGDWQLIQQEYHTFWPYLFPMGSMPVNIDFPSPFAMRAMKIFQRASSDSWNTDLGSIWGGHYSLATVPTAPVADSLAEVARLWARAVSATRHDRFQWRKDVKFTTEAPQSSVYARCSETDIGSISPDNLNLSFPILNDIQFANGNTFDGIVHQIGFRTISTDETVTYIRSLLSLESLPTLTWIDEPDMLAATNSTILAVATFPETTSGRSKLYTCGIDSRSALTDVTSYRNEYKLVSGVPPNWQNGTVASPWPQIMPTAAWAKYMNPNITRTNGSVFSSIVSTAGMWNSSLIAAPYNYPIIVEGILTTMVANGLARASYNTSMIGTLKGNNDENQWYATGWFDYFFKKSSIFTLSPEDQALATEFHVSASVIGYAYSYKGATQKAAIAVLVAYIILTVIFWTYTLFANRRFISISRKTKHKLVVMAMNSANAGPFNEHDTGPVIIEDSEGDARTRARARDRELDDYNGRNYVSNAEEHR